MPRPQPYIGFMEAYIKQLLEDIRAAHQPEEAGAEVEAMPWEGEEDRHEREMEEHFAEVERYIHEDPPHDLSYYCGVLPEQFPPAGQLNDEQLLAIVEGFVNMLLSYRIDTDLPEGLPVQKAYTLLISLLSERLWIDKWSMSTWSFCECEPSNCVYGELCSCKDLEEFNEPADGDTVGPGAEL